MKETQSLFKNQDASIRNLETQIGQLSRQIAERPQGTFPSDTIVNPKEHCKAIVTRSGKVLGNEDEKGTSDEENKQTDKEKENETQSIEKKKTP